MGKIMGGNFRGAVRGRGEATSEDAWEPSEGEHGGVTYGKTETFGPEASGSTETAGNAEQAPESQGN